MKLFFTRRRCLKTYVLIIGLALSSGFSYDYDEHKNTITDERLKIAILSLKSGKKKKGKKCDPKPLAEVRDKIIKQLSSRRQKQDQEKLKKRIYKEYKAKINKNILQNGEI